MAIQQLKDFVVRRATPADLKVVMHHRRSMFVDMGYRDEAALAAMETTSEPFFSKGLANGSYLGWLAENSSGQVVGGAGLIIFDHHSTPTDPLPKRPVAVNVYTEPEYRRRGIARELMELMIDWCRQEGFGSLLLHASSHGRPLYESLGFEPTNEMKLILR